MTALENEQRSQGGKNRAKNQDPQERKFQAMLAASSRPLKHDVSMTPEQTLRYFRALQAAHPWLYLFIVSADRHVIRHTRTNDDVLDWLKEHAGVVIGFVGLIMLGTRLQVYTKPLKRGLKVIEDLSRVGQIYTAAVIEAWQKAARSGGLPTVD
jgi:hypothetical protein